MRFLKLCAVFVLLLGVAMPAPAQDRARATVCR